jgi:hypothetical protein
VQHADDGYLILDDGGQVVSANGKARADLGTAARPGAGVPFWQAVTGTHTLVGQPSSDTPAYLIQPETGTGPGRWHRVERLPAPDVFGGRSVIRLRDVTDERRMRQSLWASRATQKYGMKLKVPKSGAGPQVAEPGRGVRADEWLRVLQTWVSLAAPTGTQVLVAGPLPTGGLVLPMEGFALLAAELLQFVRHPVSAPGREAGAEEAKAATVIAAVDGSAVVLSVRCPARLANPAELRRRWAPRYRGHVAGPADGEPDSFPDSFTGEAASLVWNVGGRVDTRADASAGWVEVAVSVPMQSADVDVFAEAENDHSLMGA